MSREKVVVREGVYGSSGYTLTIRKEGDNSIVSISPTGGVSLSWKFGADGVFESLGAGERGEGSTLFAEARAVPVCEHVTPNFEGRICS